MRQLYSLFLILILIGFSCSNLTTQDQATWNISFKKVKITPETPQWIAGYDRDTKSIGIHDDIWAKVMAISNGQDTVIVVSTDLIGLFKDDVDDIRKRIASEFKRRDNIIITCTHNHNGPDVMGLWNADKTKSGVDPQYLEFVKENISSMILSAITSFTKARLYLTSTEVNGISYNGRDKDITDNSVVILQATSLDGHTIGTLVNFACHPEVLTSKNKLITSDYAHYMYQKLATELGGISLLINGALGGMLTPLVKEHSYEEAERCGNTLGDAVLLALKKADPVKSSELLTLNKTVELNLENDTFKWLYDNNIIHRVFNGNLVQTEVNVLKIGELLISTIPGEALPKIGLNIKEKMASPYKMIFGLANDELGYLIPGEDWKPDAYEESMSIGKTAGDAIQNELLRMLKKM